MASLQAAPVSPRTVGCLSGPGWGLRGLSLRLESLGSRRPLENSCLFHWEDAGQLFEVRLGGL